MSRRRIVTASAVVDRAPDEVFGYLADVSRHGEWSPRPYRTEGLQPGPVTVGTRFVSYGWIPRDAEHRNDVEVTEVDRPRRFMLISREGGESFVNTFTLTPEGEGTRVERRLDMPTPTGAAGVLFPLLIAGLIRPAVQKGLNMLKQNLERREDL